MVHDYFLESRGIAYRSNGMNPGKKTLLFIHGLSGSASAWYPYEEFFGREYNVVTYDLRGHGHSVRPRWYRQYSFDYFVDDLRALLGYLGVRTCTVLSHSFGAIVARDFIAAEPKLISGAVFLAAPYRLRDTWHAYTAWSAYAGRAIAELWPLSLPIGRRLDYKNFHHTPDWDFNRISREVYQMGVRSYLRCLTRQYADRDEGWERVAVPSILVHGTIDAFVPVSQARALATAVPHATLKLIEGANHMLVLNNIQELRHIITDFIR